MRDLSSLAANGPWVTSQAGGNMTSSNEQAMTGKGTKPVDPLPDRDHQGDPHVTPIDKPRSVLEHGDDGQAYAPWGSRGPGGWSVADDDAGTVTGGWSVA